MLCSDRAPSSLLDTAMIYVRELRSVLYFLSSRVVLLFCARAAEASPREASCPTLTENRKVLC